MMPIALLLLQGTIGDDVPLHGCTRYEDRYQIIICAYSTCKAFELPSLYNIMFYDLISISIAYITAKQKHLGCKKGEANQKQQLSDYRCIRT